MKKNSFIIKKVTYLALALITLYVSAKVATLAYNHKTLVDGLLGIVNLYLLYLLLLLKGSSTSKLFEAQIEYPRDLKYLFLSFFVWLVIYWSSRNIILAFMYIRDILK